MHFAIIIAHEAQRTCGDSDRLCADAKKAADIDDHLGRLARSMNMGDRTDGFVVGAVDDCVDQGVLGIVHCFDGGVQIVVHEVVLHDCTRAKVL